MKKITFVIPSRNNLEFLKLAYSSIRNLKKKHEILILDDASTDGTAEWIKTLNDPGLIAFVNEGPERIGIVGTFDKGIELASTEIIFAFHADMVAGPKLDENILRHLKRGTVVSATRVEPPLHPPGPEKIIQSLGNEVKDFSLDSWYEWSNVALDENSKKITDGIFAPWCMYKEDFLAIGGHDELFAPQSREDSDLFNRFHLAGYKFVQPWDALVYHFTSRGSRFNKHAGGDTLIDSKEWKQTNKKNSRNFVRKWGTVVQHDDYMKPKITPKYNIAFKVINCSAEILYHLEPWCDRIYSNADLQSYIIKEQPNTKYNLNERCYSLIDLDKHEESDIVVEIDASQLTEDRFGFIMNLSNIINESGGIGSTEYDIFIINIHSMKTYEGELINA